MQELLLLCAKIEKAISDLYFLFQDIFSSQSEEYGQLWKKTAQEELNHEQQFLMAARLYSKQLIPDDLVDREKLITILQSIQSLTERAKVTPPNMEQAVLLALNFEEQLVETHLDAVLQFDDDAVNRLFKAMKAADQEHVQALKSFHQTYIVGASSNS